ncbi:serine/threonine protein kinase [Haliangium ochraceum DSM 14365]|uniref:Serine/threonine protein kinase n=2 Tax=Haliangium ochraceum TaxID=80816 RepID=D0LTX6_HALO1|nr:serine/threonine protein kinase [Haliangium ochraceum DSM 14365]
MRDIRTGDVFQERYEVLEKLSEGGFGVVYKARQLTTGQMVAIKVMRWSLPHESGGEMYRERFRRESALCAELHHPNIVQLIDSGETEADHMFMVFEFIPGKELGRVIAEEGALSPRETKHIMGQVLDALSCAHALGIVHRDLKPGNIMLVHTGARRNAKVLDFGIAGLVPDHGDDEQSHVITAPLERVGTPAYAAPEQLRGKPATARSDLYAWGLVFLECLTGARVIRGASLPDTIYRQLEPTPIPLPSALSEHPLGTLLGQVTTKDVNERAITAVEALAQLDACEVSALRMPPPPRPATPLPETLETVTGRVAASADTMALAPGEFPAATVSPASTTATPAPRTHDTARSDATMLQVFPEGERRQITAVSFVLRVQPLTSDGVDIDEQAELLSTYKQFCRRLIERASGFVASTLGNRLLACFGYPKAQADDARRAVATGLAALRKLGDENQLLEERQRVRLDVQIGAHTGMVLIRGQAHAPTPDDIFGDTLALAGRVAELSAPGTVSVSAQALRLVRSAYQVGPARLHDVDELSEKLAVHVVQGPAESTSTPALVARDSGRLGQVGDDSPLVGRDEEIALLRRAWRQSRDGNGQAVLITGEAGIGKTRLARELGLRLAGGAHTWLECRCMAANRNSAMRPVIDLFERRLGFEIERSAEDKAARLEDMLRRYGLDLDESMPLLAPLLGVSLPRRYLPRELLQHQRREQTLRALSTLMVEMALDRPLLIVVEDLHWADPSSLALLGMLLESVPTLPICMVLTARPAFELPWRGATIAQIQVGRLSAESAVALVLRLLGEQRLPTPLIEQILRRTDGVPLFIEELTRAVLESGVAQASDEAHTPKRASELEIPATLRDSLMARLDLLAPTAKATAQIAALLGREFPLDQLRAVAPFDDAQLQAALDALVDAELVYRRRRISGDVYTFKHALVQETACDALPRRARKQYHARIAEVLEQRFAEHVANRPEVLMTHYAEAGALPRAVEYACQAGRAALLRSASKEAIAYAERGLGWMAALRDDPRRDELELRINAVLVPAMMATYGFSSPEFRVLMRRARAIEGAASDGERDLLTLWGMFSSHFSRAEHELAGDMAAMYLQAAEHAGDIDHQLNGCVAVAVSRLYRGRFVDARQFLERALSYCTPETPERRLQVFNCDPCAAAQSQLGVVLWLLGQPRDARAMSDIALARTGQHGHPLSRIMALFLDAVREQLEGDTEAVADRTSEILYLAREHDMPRWVSMGTVMASWASGDLESAEQVLEHFRETGHKLRRTYWDTLLAEIEIRRGEFDAALARIDDCLYTATETQELAHDIRALQLAGTCHLRRGEAEQAEAAWRDALRRARERSAHLPAVQVVTDLARLLVDSGRRDEARELLSAALEAIRDGRDSTVVRGAQVLLTELEQAA